MPGYLVLLALSMPLRSLAADMDYMLRGPFSDKYAHEVLKNEIQKRLPSGVIPKVEIVAFKIPEAPPSSNPFNIGNNFNYGDYFTPLGRKQGPIPEIDPSDASWFQELVDKKICPQYFIIAGHQVISHGWHDHEETRFMFLPTFMTTARKYPAARQILNCVKVAVLFGCNTMTNLEPHRVDGESSTQEDIRSLYQRARLRPLE